MTETSSNTICDTARVTEDKAKKRRTVKIGGIDNRQGARYVICLHHKDAVDGDIWVMIVGNNQAGFINFLRERQRNRCDPAFGVP